MKIFIVIASVVAFANCEPYDEAEANAAQPAFINATIANLTEIANGNKLLVLPRLISYVNTNCKTMDKLMMEESDRCEEEGLTIMKEFYDNIHSKVYEWGLTTAEAELPAYALKNATDGKLALAKFAATTNVIRWRVELDKERRANHPTECKDEQGGWADWNNECKKVVSVLEELVPKLEEAKSAFWAHQHQRMLDYIKKGIPKLNEAIKAEESEEKREKTLCLLAEDLHLLNTVASSRPPGSK